MPVIIFNIPSIFFHFFRFSSSVPIPLMVGGVKTFSSPRKERENLEKGVDMLNVVVDHFRISCSFWRHESRVFFFRPQIPTDRPASHTTKSSSILGFSFFSSPFRSPIRTSLLQHLSSAFSHKNDIFWLPTGWNCLTYSSLSSSLSASREGQDSF